MFYLLTFQITVAGGSKLAAVVELMTVRLITDAISVRPH
jgi:hypothetical protein